MCSTILSVGLTMKYFFSIFVLVIVACNAFMVQPLTKLPASTTALNMVFGNRKSSTQKKEEESKYWQGEWVCKDCGYIYNRVSFTFKMHISIFGLANQINSPSCLLAISAYSRRLNALVCTSRNRALDLDAPSALARAVVTQRKLATALEPLWTVETLQFSSLASAVLLPPLPLASGLSITCKSVLQLKLRSPGILQLRIFDYLNQIATARLRSYIYAGRKQS